MSRLGRWLERRFGGKAQMYEALAGEMERAGLREIRARLAGSLRGRVLEVGCGTGLNFAHYPPEAQVLAIEPERAFRAMAHDRAIAAAAAIEVIDGDVHALPFADGSFDAALVTLVFCSVPDAELGLQEVRRVVRPGGEVLFFEHVRDPRPWRGMLQDLLNPVWKRAMDGCNLNRTTVELIRAAGFTVESVDPFQIQNPRAALFPMREVRARA